MDNIENDLTSSDGNDKMKTFLLYSIIAILIVLCFFITVILGWVGKGRPWPCKELPFTFRRERPYIVDHPVNSLSPRSDDDIVHVEMFGDGDDDKQPLLVIDREELNAGPWGAPQENQEPNENSHPSQNESDMKEEEEEEKEKKKEEEVLESTSEDGSTMHTSQHPISEETPLFEFREFQRKISRGRPGFS